MHTPVSPIPGRRISKCKDLDAGVGDKGKGLEMRLQRETKAVSAGLQSLLSTLDFILSVLGRLWRVLKSGIT